MTDEIPAEKSYRDWLAEALAQDEHTWELLERKLETLRVRNADVVAEHDGVSAEGLAPDR